MEQQKKSNAGVERGDDDRSLQRSAQGDGGADEGLGQLKAILKGFADAKSDENRFVSLLLLAKSNIVAREDMIGDVHSVVGYGFIKRLLRSKSKDLGGIYMQIGLSILSLYARSKDIASSEGFQDCLPLVGDAIVRLVESGRIGFCERRDGDTKTNSKVDEDKSDNQKECIVLEADGEEEQQQEEKSPTMEASNNNTQQTDNPQQQQQQHEDNHLFDAMHAFLAGIHALNVSSMEEKDNTYPFCIKPLNALAKCFNSAVVVDETFMTLYLSLLAEVGMKCCSRNSSLFHRVVTSLVQIVNQQKKNSVQFKAVNTLSAVLQRVDAFPSKSMSSSTSNWMDDLLPACTNMLSNRLGEDERKMVLKLISLASYHVPFSSLKQKTLNSCMPLVSRRAAVEVRMNLELPSLEECLDHLDLLACSLDVVEESMLALITHSDGDALDAPCVENTLQACKMAIGSVNFFFDNCSEESWKLVADNVPIGDASSPSWLLICACCRLLDRWLANWSGEDLDEEMKSVTFVLNKIWDIEESCEEKGLFFHPIVTMLPGICSVTADEDIRCKLLKETSYVDLVCEIIRNTTTVWIQDEAEQNNATKIHSKGDKKSSSSILVEACNVLLNVLVEDNEYVNRSVSLEELALMIIASLSAMPQENLFAEPSVMLCLVASFAVHKNAGKGFQGKEGRTISALEMLMHLIGSMEFASDDAVVGCCSPLSLLLMVADGILKRQTQSFSKTQHQEFLSSLERGVLPWKHVLQDLGSEGANILHFANSLLTTRK
eukprot:m.157380 g.157380  ORF g.157380 m.157380 type:complete len:773 (+) comp13346_c0_seq6:157-2475(+)